MRFTQRSRRVLIPLAFAGVAGLALTGCTGDIAAQDKGDTDCSPYEEYGTFENESVDISGTIVDTEADLMTKTWQDFAACTGIDVNYQGTQEFETQITVQAKAGNAPDIGIVPQPGLFNSLAEGGYLKPASQAVEDHVDEFWSEDWKTYGTYNDEFLAAPLMASVKGYIWYSPSEFKDKGYEIPKTLDELKELSDTIAAEGDHKPWCAGMESGEASGWPGTDWIEDFVLRQAGPDVYDQWVTHEIPFNDPAIVKAFDSAAEYLKDPEMVNGGLGDVSTVISTAFGDAGLPILDGECSLHHQASFYEGFWPEGTKVAADGDVYAFLMPPTSADAGQAVTGGGELVVAFTESDAVEAVRAYLSSDTWANKRVSLGGVISANSGLDPENAGSDILKDSVKILQNPDTVFRFDGSDLMPSAVGASSFWTGIIEWLNGKSSQDVADTIESSWPSS
ncbi:ABC transporter substrate-binding protein [Paramicrobacterium chengjingii]|uniref:Carbohydrate ABC transporter substrate-binding protein n=1 Tax=Paramicrobacterium chengjingii TaxID=2769067 RepID=A0ABX6YJT1_9MICO|nr:ABC transporter substrate-binding protein [Microbacterium chengjingii]QPZ39071.1 carbohydrate ABC transporter substrate-binding protein [Microbacterium chengjingii]